MKLKYLPESVLLGSLGAFWAPSALGTPPGKPAEPVGSAKAAGLRAEIVLPKEPLGGATFLEVRFATAMVKAEITGKTTDAAEVLEIKPPLAGVFRWQSVRSGTFEPAGGFP